MTEKNDKQGRTNLRVRPFESARGDMAKGGVRRGAGREDEENSAAEKREESGAGLG